MIRWIITQSLKFRFLMVAVGGALMIVGAGQVGRMPIDVFPEFAPPRVEIQTPCLGLSAAETEALVTIPLEQALQGVPGLETLRSKSVSQLSSIELIFDSGTDLIDARQRTNERLQTVVPSLPTWAAPPFILQPLSATSRVMKIGLSSDTVSMIDMSMMSYWNIRSRLLRVPGVANVAIWGERLDMYQVQVEPERLKANGVTLDDVMEATAETLDSGLLQYTEQLGDGEGRLRRDAQPAPHGAPRPADRGRGGPRRGRGHRPQVGTRTASQGRREGGHGPPATRSGTPSSTAVRG